MKWMVGDMSFKPLLAKNAELDKIKFPLLAQPKLDGVRGLMPTDFLVGRSLKMFDNRYINQSDRINCPQFRGMDGELVLGDNPLDSALCRHTTSALTSFEGEPNIHWHVFDICSLGMADTPYEKRYNLLRNHVEDLRRNHGFNHIHIIDSVLVNNIDEFLELDSKWVELGYEGTIGRNPLGKYKHGRAGIRNQECLKLKQYVDDDARILRFEEAMTNLNEAQINELGYTFRTSHKENLIGAGMVGAIWVEDLKTGKEVKIGAGTLTHAERIKLWQQPEQFIGKYCKYKHFPHGVKDRARHPTFLEWRAEVDMS